MSMAPSRIRQWLTPLVYLSNNFISLVGVVLTTASAILWIFLLPTLWKGTTENPYVGILLFLMLPGVFFGGLLLIPLGIFIRTKRNKAAGKQPTEFPPLDWKNTQFRRLAIFVAATTIVNVIIAGQLTYGAVGYMESVEFCGKTCHNVMQPEFTAYQNSPHSRVECVKCHIGAGADWFVRSKLSGLGQVIAVTFNTYPRPIPTPVHNLRPARETCETCHWPQKFGGDRLRVINKFAEDEQNTQSQSVLMMHIGGGNGGVGIHGVHLGDGVLIKYAPADESRQTIPVVDYKSNSGDTVRFIADGTKPEDVARLAAKMRVMDCMDCHNRPSHTMQLPERAIDLAIAQGSIVQSLPWAKKQGLELLKATYRSHEEGTAAISRGFEKFYQEKYPEIYNTRRADITKSGVALGRIYTRNVFPDMNVKWGDYPNNIGHTDFPGCFRCHDDLHNAKSGQKINQDCTSCHGLLAMEEPSPKILTDLGVGPAQGPAQGSPSSSPHK